MTRKILSTATTDFPTLDSPIYWSLDRYHRAIAAGVLTQEDRVELIEGKLVPTMPIGELHAYCVSELLVYFASYLGSYRVRSENPILIVPDSEPEPDFVIATKPSDPDLKKAHPRAEEILLLIEVSASTLEYDRGKKAELYAKADISEYWIVDLNHGQLEVRTQPHQASAAYGSVSIYRRGEQFESPFHGTVNVSDVVPEISEDESQ